MGVSCRVESAATTTRAAISAHLIVVAGGWQAVGAHGAVVQRRLGSQEGAEEEDELSWKEGVRVSRDVDDKSSAGLSATHAATEFAYRTEDVVAQVHFALHLEIVIRKLLTLAHGLVAMLVMLKDAVGRLARRCWQSRVDACGSAKDGGWRADG